MIGTKLQNDIIIRYDAEQVMLIYFLVYSVRYDDGISLLIQKQLGHHTW